MNSETVREEVDLSSKAREIAHIQEKSLKQRIAKKYNSAIVPRQFEEGHLVLRYANIGPPPSRHGKLVADWEGLYQVTEILEKRGV